MFILPVPNYNYEQNSINTRPPGFQTRQICCFTINRNLIFIKPINYKISFSGRYTAANKGNKFFELFISFILQQCTELSIIFVAVEWKLCISYDFLTLSFTKNWTARKNSNSNSKSTLKPLILNIEIQVDINKFWGQQRIFPHILRLWFCPKPTIYHNFYFWCAP